MGPHTNMRFLIKLIGGWLILVAIITFVADFTSASTTQLGFEPTSVAEHWQAINRASFDKAQNWFVQHAPNVWNLGILAILQIPSWALMLALGMFGFWITRKRKRIEVFAN